MSRLLEVKNLKTSFRTHIGDVQAVRGVSLYLDKGEALGIVGESGCGKSVTMMSLMRLLADNAIIESDNIMFDGQDITNPTEKEMQKIRGNEMAMIFQDPMTSLNPLFTVGQQLTEHLIKHKKVSKKEANDLAIKMLDMVGIPSPEKRLKQYPHEFSGGMRQRVMIAMSLICEPKLIIADEPTTALDVTIQAQILDLMKGLKEKVNSSIILITHDLGVVADLCTRINVMYGGLVVEEGSDEDIFYNGKHPYTWGLLNSVPNPKSEIKEKLTPIEGQPPDLLKPPVGCPFAARCKYTMKVCIEKQPPLFEISEGHRAACWLCHENAPKVESPVRREE
ncbi:ABC transporter ATP-binding protein [Clostridium tertium]|jgi:oligopeptide transport system ATP-binding protein|uniref:ABC transporter ATP-binding protein n=1 Tax=Clostridium TaxID=1485 RepID=UPI0002F87247|nr:MULTISPECIES: ABC transporter ATP-binding protein [Clostridium]MBS5306381.1 ABC transporter ATP-binding protein [Clostridium sp.]MBU6135098.1 ABC transporter ATP-binding protein [Clostridium tertium]MDB1923243.1 ABC transporter ATP-binding protein [Clostridium tertium]MDB1926824.1 ABC transporter ATP-binding protein [Clostridium tertium]MDB1930344.1 ABC transporter ATP-binding protein [Clostridium tertium]